MHLELQFLTVVPFSLLHCSVHVLRGRLAVLRVPGGVLGVVGGGAGRVSFSVLCPAEAPEETADVSHCNLPDNPHCFQLKYESQVFVDLPQQ